MEYDNFLQNALPIKAAIVFVGVYLYCYK